VPSAECRFTDTTENEYGSNPTNAASTREHKQFDIAFSQMTCQDTIDNDLDTFTDIGLRPVAALTVHRPVSDDW